MENFSDKNYENAKKFDPKNSNTWALEKVEPEEWTILRYYAKRARGYEKLVDKNLAEVANLREIGYDNIAGQKSAELANNFDKLNKMKTLREKLLNAMENCEDMDSMGGGGENLRPRDVLEDKLEQTEKSVERAYFILNSAEKVEKIYERDGDADQIVQFSEDLTDYQKNADQIRDILRNIYGEKDARSAKIQEFDRGDFADFEDENN